MSDFDWEKYRRPDQSIDLTVLILDEIDRCVPADDSPLVRKELVDIAPMYAQKTERKQRIKSREVAAAWVDGALLTIIGQLELAAEMDEQTDKTRSYVRQLCSSR